MIHVPALMAFVVVKAAQAYAFRKLDQRVDGYVRKATDDAAPRDEQRRDASSS